jgi:hypothetical protein
MKNNYGNFVVQKALKLARSPFKEKLITTIAKNIENIGDKKIIVKWQGIILEYINNDYKSFDNNVYIDCYNSRVLKTAVVNNDNFVVNLFGRK